jgi:probable F420-dependent oxidoreductase
VTQATSRSRPFRFGVVTTNGSNQSVGNWTEYSRMVESLGFAVLLVADHYGNGTVCTPRLAAAAAVTTSLRLGSYVYDNDFRHPVLLAREAAEIDVLSNGRMELGVGAGWAKDEYDMVGVRFDDGPIRASRFEEAVGIIRSLHEGGTVTHAGPHYQLAECALYIEPVQRPIPLLLGGGGPRMIRFAAQHADTVAFVPRSLPGGGIDPLQFSADRFDDKITILEESLLTRAGPEPERAALAFEVHRSVDDVPENDWTSRDIAASSPYTLIGDTPRIVNTLQERRERWGISHWTCWEEDLEIMSPVVAELAGR